MAQQHDRADEKFLREYLIDRLLMSRIMARPEVERQDCVESLRELGPEVRAELQHWDTHLLLQHLAEYIQKYQAVSPSPS